MNRRSMLTVLAGALVASARPAVASASIQVFKNPDCGCCAEWVKHLEATGFAVRTTNVSDTAPVRKRLGMPEQYGSCHTGVADGYVIEGHVPASDIRRLLEQRPDAIGLAVPGMPVGSPGMEIGDRKDPYDVLLIGRSGDARVFARHNRL